MKRVDCVCDSRPHRNHPPDCQMFLRKLESAGIIESQMLAWNEGNPSMGIDFRYFWRSEEIMTCAFIFLIDYAVFLLLIVGSWQQVPSSGNFEAISKVTRLAFERGDYLLYFHDAHEEISRKQTISLLTIWLELVDEIYTRFGDLKSMVYTVVFLWW